MERQSHLKRAQSLRSVFSSCEKSAWAGRGLQDKTTSVSQLVARYQTTVKVSPIIHAVENEGQPRLTETPALLQNKETHLETLMRRNDERERSRSKTKLTRSKSTGSLQKSSGSIEALRTLFESKSATENKMKNSFRAADSRHMADMSLMNGEVEGVKSAAVAQKTHTHANAKAVVKEDQKVMNQSRRERRKTIGGIDFEEIAASEAGEFQTT
ncbi:uncharacterized protein LOC114453583 [Parambassis ranga]|uniref:Uncharacterized protein LOC114453583 n=1 Tax=Parambassis ranga TaxID=210632 RepID=A0A6P7KPF3_9TELE|nr:uncharacterized protein LOC114453583 [Parambassis ranga]